VYIEAQDMGRIIDYGKKFKADEDEEAWFDYIQSFSWDAEENHYGEPDKCNHIVKSWCIINDKYEKEICLNCFKIFEIRVRK
jgi:hypothetical protein